MDVILQNFEIIIIMFFLLFFSAFFSGTETALFSLNRYQLFHLEKEKRKSSVLITLLMQNPSKTLVSILLGNLTVNILFFCLSTIINAALGCIYGIFMQFVFGILILFVVIIFGEILPKAIGIKCSLHIARFSSYPVFIWLKISLPIRTLVSLIVNVLIPKPGKTNSEISGAELKFLLDVSEEKGAISGNTSEMIEDIIALADLRAKHIMIPRIDIIQCPDYANQDEAIEKARRNGKYILPVFHKVEGEIIGYLDIKELCLSKVKRNVKVKELIYSAKFVPETKNVAELLKEMQKKHLKVVFVVDEYGDISGMITKEKILEEITGGINIEKEVSDLPLVAKIKKNEYRIQASLPFNEWREIFLEELDSINSYSFASIGGFVVSLLGRNPKVGDVVNFKNLSFEIEKVIRNRIITLILRVE